MGVDFYGSPGVSVEGRDVCLTYTTYLMEVTSHKSRESPTRAGIIPHNLNSTVGTLHRD